MKQIHNKPLLSSPSTAAGLHGQQRIRGAPRTILLLFVLLLSPDPSSPKVPGDPVTSRPSATSMAAARGDVRRSPSMTRL
ncbi:hypothetical protein BS78_05G122800 [Paspalum vaginatum]|nr:hypothetical protein BS78_05G122800 [Paspalum vaginatum]